MYSVYNYRNINLKMVLKLKMAFIELFIFAAVVLLIILAAVQYVCL